MNNKQQREAKGLLELAARYLDHPDVKPIPFALPSEAVAKRIRRFIEKVEEK